jgi:hypothetical protein
MLGFGLLSVTIYATVVILVMQFGPETYGVHGLVYAVLASYELILRLGLPQANDSLGKSAFRWGIGDRLQWHVPVGRDQPGRIWCSVASSAGTRPTIKHHKWRGYSGSPWSTCHATRSI